MRLQTGVFRPLNPVWIDDPFSGDGTRRHGGRFNPGGLPAFYCRSDLATAARVVNQTGQTLQQTILVGFQPAILPVIDATDLAALAGQGVTPAMLAANNSRRRKS